MNYIKILSIILICSFIFIGCGAKTARQARIREPGWISGKANDELYYYGVGGPAPTVQEAEEHARASLAKRIEVTIEAEMTSIIVETNEKSESKFAAKSRSYVRQKLKDVDIKATYSNAQGHYTLASLSKLQFREWVEAPFLETQADVLHHLREGERAIQKGRLIQALSEFGQGLQKAQTLPPRYDWMDEQKTDRYTAHLTRRLDNLVDGVTLQIVSGDKQTGEIQTALASPLVFKATLNSEKPLKQLPIKAECKDKGVQLRAVPSGQIGEKVMLQTDAEGQGRICVQKMGKEIGTHQVVVSVDISQIPSLYSILGREHQTRLTNKSITFVCNATSNIPASGETVAVSPFHKLSDDKAQRIRDSRPQADFQGQDAFELFLSADKYHEDGQLDRAIEIYEKALRMSPNFAEGHNNLGVAYQDKGLLDNAMREYKLAIRLKPNYPEAYNNLGWALLQAGDVDGAIAKYQQALKYGTEFVHIQINLAWAYHQKGDYDTAIRINQEILNKHPDELLARYNLALAYLCKGDTKRAEKEYKIAFKLTDSPENRAYRNALSDLEQMCKKGRRAKDAQRILELLSWKNR